MPDATDQITAMAHGLPRTRHLTTNLTVEVDEEAGAAVARSYVTVLQALPDFAPQPIFTGRVQACLWRDGNRAVAAR